MKLVKKYGFAVIILLITLYFTFTSIYDKQSLNIIFINLKKINPIYIIICLLMIFIYFLLQGLYMKFVLNTLKTKTSIFRCMFYSIVEFFYSGITPSSTGGQPVQLYYMTKDKIPIRKSYITLVLDTIYFKIILLLLGIVVLFSGHFYIFEGSFIYVVFFILGFLIDLLLTILGLCLLFKMNFIKSLFTKLLTFLKRFRLFDKFTNKINIDETFSKYKDEIKFIKSHKKTVFFSFIITFIQRIILFSIIYVVYHALGFNKYNYFDLLIIQVGVQIAIEALPLPGGAGLSENMLHDSFLIIFASKLADVGMLLTRAFTFYIPIVLSGIIILVDYIFSKKKFS